jgi:hypothetical protein
MTDTNLQKDLFNQIKTLLPPHVSMVDTIAELLSISYDSVYRRIRGEKPISLDELKLICEHFNLSLDQVLQLHSNKVLFTDNEANETISSFIQYEKGLIQQLQYFNQFQKKDLLYLCKDIPVFHFFYFKELAAFKAFFWAKSILNEPEFENRNFNLHDFEATEYFDLGKKILEGYNEIPSTELWNYESINSTVLQIEYYRDAGIFETTKDLYAVVDSFDATLAHLQKQVEKGRKFMPGIGEAGYKAPLKFYINEIILGNNSILVTLDDAKTVFINHIVLKYISTTDKRFTAKAFGNFQNLVSRSVLISETGEKERNKFFKLLRERVQACKK